VEIITFTAVKSRSSLISGLNTKVTNKDMIQYAMLEAYVLLHKSRVLSKLPLNPVEAQKSVERQGKLTQIVNQIKL
jgi:hypothetical protein